MQNSEFLKLNLRDFGRGIVTAVLAGAFVAVIGVFHQAGFDVFSADWAAIANLAINGGIAALVGYLAKNFLSDSQGNFLGTRRL